MNNFIETSEHDYKTILNHRLGSVAGILREKFFKFILFTNEDDLDKLISMMREYHRIKVESKASQTQ